MANNELFYKHSGRFEPTGVAWSFAAMIGAGVGMGYLYGVLTWVVPFIYVVVLGTIGLGLLVGFLSTVLTIKANTRNNTLIVLGPALASLAAFYSAWAGYLFAASDWQYFFWEPVEIVSTIQRIAENGLWSMFGNTPTGLVLYSIWLVEAAIIVGLGLILGIGHINNPPFSENAGAWADQTEVLPPAKALTPETIRQVREQIKHGDLSCFGLFEPLNDGDFAGVHTSFRVAWAPGHEQEQFLTITSVMITEDEQGNVQTNNTPIANNMIIDPEARAVIDDILQSDFDPDPEEQAEPVG
jgi:hypothetical protein